MQTIMDFNRRPRPNIEDVVIPIAPVAQEQILFKQDKPGTVYVPSTF